MALIGKPTCVSCKHFVMMDGMQNPECHLFPPVTTPFIIGIDKVKGPIVHNVISYNLVRPDFDCAQHAPKIDLRT